MGELFFHLQARVLSVLRLKLFSLKLCVLLVQRAVSAPCVHDFQKVKKNSRFDYGFLKPGRFVCDETVKKDKKARSSRFRDGQKKPAGGNFIKTVIAFCVAISVSVAPLHAEQNTQQRYDFDIPQMSVADALNEFSEQTGAVLLFPYELVEGRSAKRLVGEYGLSEALEILLDGSGLSGGLVQSEVIRISLGTENTETIREETAVNNQVKRSLLASAAALVFGTSAPSVAIAQGSASADEERREDVIIVTATKRGGQDINDTAMSISAVGSEEIARRGLVNTDDILDSLPGVSYIDQGPGFASPIIRGVNSFPGLVGSSPSGTTGTYLGEMPITSLGFAGNSSEIKLIDLERVEILRGPQGSLYGAASLGGVVRYIPATPNLSEVEGSFTAEYSKTAEGGGNNSLLEGVLNIPLVDDKLALRVAAYHIDDSGFYNNVAASDPVTSGVGAFGGVALDAGDIGAVQTTGVRATLLWEPNEALSIMGTYLYQELDEHGRGQVDIGTTVGDQYAQRRVALVFPADTPTGLSAPVFPEQLRDEISIYNLVVEYDFGLATVTSSSSYGEGDSFRARDVSPFLGGVPGSQPGPSEGESFVQELRVSSQLEGPFQFLVGGYYEEQERFLGNFLPFAGDPALSPFGPNPVLVENTFLRNYEQISVFGELTYDLTDQLRLIAGVRYFDYESEFDFVRPGGSVFLPDAGRDLFGSEEDGTSFKAGLEYRPNEDALIYGTFSQGFRLGHPEPPQSLPVSLCDADGDGFYDGGSNSVPFNTGPNQVESDTLDSYEVGAKISLAGGRVQLNGALFHLEWENFPSFVAFDSGCGLTVNAGSARSQGIELDGSFELTDGLTLNLSGSYTDAEITENRPEADIFDGDRLPGSPEFNVSASLLNEFSFLGYDAFANLNYTYIGGFRSTVRATRLETGPEAGDYGLLSLSAGVDLTEELTLMLTADNLTNEDDFSFIGNDVPGVAYRLRPRTVGVRASYRF